MNDLYNYALGGKKMLGFHVGVQPFHLFFLLVVSTFEKHLIVIFMFMLPNIFRQHGALLH